MPGSNVSIVIHRPFQASGLTSSGYNKACIGVREGAAIKIYPTSAGTATVYSSCSPVADCMEDIASGNFTTGSASWDEWSASGVTAKTTQVASMPLSCVVCVPASGTWTFEIVQ